MKAIFEGAPQELIEQAARTAESFKNLCAKEEAHEIAEEELSKARCLYRFENKTYQRMVSEHVPPADNTGAKPE